MIRSLVTVVEVQRILRVDRRVIRRMVNEGWLEEHRRNGRWLFCLSDVAAIIADKTLDPVDLRCACVQGPCVCRTPTSLHDA